MDKTISLRVHFTVKDEDVEQTLACIRKFLSAINEREQGSTLLYKSFQNKLNPTAFYHVMIFKDEAAQKAHQSASHTKEFVNELYPLCEKEPGFTETQEVK